MRVTKWGIGIVMAGAILLTGCAAPTDSAGSGQTGSDASEKPSAAASDCPELAEGATVDGDALSECVAEAMADTKGFTATMTVMGMESPRRYSPADQAVETTTEYGSMITIGDEAWVKPATGEWQVADTASPDPDVAALSTGATTIDHADPLGLTSTLAGEYTVTGTSTRLDQDVFLISGTIDEQGSTLDVLMEVTPDYVVLASTASTDVEGQKVAAVVEITDWDVKQDIVAPL